jgi:hypothetical protein
MGNHTSQSIGDEIKNVDGIVSKQVHFTKPGKYYAVNGNVCLPCHDFEEFLENNSGMPKNAYWDFNKFAAKDHGIPESTLLPYAEYCDFSLSINSPLMHHVANRVYYDRVWSKNKIVKFDQGKRTSHSQRGYIAIVPGEIDGEMVYTRYDIGSRYYIGNIQSIPCEEFRKMDLSLDLPLHDWIKTECNL